MLMYHMYTPLLRSSLLPTGPPQRVVGKAPSFCARTAKLSSGEAKGYTGGMKLYSYFRSGAAYRARIALNLKGVPYDIISVHLRRGEHLSQDYKAINPQARIPALELDDGMVIAQSPAILEYLEEKYPDPPLLPKDPAQRARVRALAAMIACDIHPLNNLGTLNYLRGELAQGDAAVDAWCAHWIRQGFAAIEAMISPAPYSFGRDITLADIYIVPQVATAQRLNVSLDGFPKILGIDAACRQLDAFKRAHPMNQPDTEA